MRSLALVAVVLGALLAAACAADKPRPAAPNSPEALPLTPVASAPPEPVAAAPTVPPEPVVARACDERRLQVAIARATGEGSFILRLSCAGSVFAISSDRAKPTGEELTAVFKVSALDWEKAYRAIEELKWRAFDDACGPNEQKVGMSPGPVYRVEIQDSVDRRSFHCAGVRAFTDPLDQLHARLLAMAPPSSPTGAGAGDRTGVQECDAFLDKYMRCIADKVPTAERPDFEQALADTRVRLRDALVADPSAGPTIGKTCDRLQDEAKKGTAKYRCKF